MSDNPFFPFKIPYDVLDLIDILLPHVRCGNISPFHGYACIRFYSGIRCDYFK